MYQSVQCDLWLATLSNAWQRSGCTEAQIRQRYEDIPNRSDAGVLNVSISRVWRQFPWLGVACLVSFLDSLTVGGEKISQNDA